MNGFLKFLSVRILNFCRLHVSGFVLETFSFEESLVLVSLDLFSEPCPACNMHMRFHEGLWVNDVMYLELHVVLIFSPLMQRYDTDPAAKAAAATVLASKLGAESGLKVFVGDESQLDVATAKSNDVELTQSSGLRNRKQLQTRSGYPANPTMHPSEGEMPHQAGVEGTGTSGHDQLVVEHYPHQGVARYDGGWIARIAALLVGEDPTQSYALICGNCHMHNGKWSSIHILNPPGLPTLSFVISSGVFGLVQALPGRRISPT